MNENKRKCPQIIQLVHQCAHKNSVFVYVKEKVFMRGMPKAYKLDIRVYSRLFALFAFSFSF